MNFRLIVDNEHRDRRDCLVTSFRVAIDLCEGAIDTDGFLSARVFDDSGHIVAQAYKDEGSVLRP